MLSIHRTFQAAALAFTAGCGTVPPSSPSQDGGIDATSPIETGMSPTDASANDRFTNQEAASNAGSDRVNIDAAPLPLSLRRETPTPFVNFDCDFVSGAFLSGSRAYLVCPGNGEPDPTRHTPNKILSYDIHASSTATASMSGVIAAMERNGAIANSVTVINDRWVAVVAGNVGIPTSHGVYITSTSAPWMAAFFAFPAGVTTGGDAAQVGNSLYVSAAGFNGTGFRPGQIVAYPINPDATSAGAVLSTPRIATQTQYEGQTYENPTGLARWASSQGNRLVIGCSGNYTGPAHRAALLVYNTGRNAMEAVFPFPDDFIAAPHIRVAGSSALVGSSTPISSDPARPIPPDGRFYVIHLNERAMPAAQRIDGDRFHAGVEIIGGLGLLADFPGHITAFPLTAPMERASLDLAPQTGIGPSLQVNDHCLDYYATRAGVRVCVGM